MYAIESATASFVLLTTTSPTIKTPIKNKILLVIFEDKSILFFIISIKTVENIVSGGLNGQDSIRNGLLDIYKRYNSDDDVVLIHDAIRPMLLPEIITDNIKICREYGNAITVVPCTAAMLKTYNSISTEEQVARDNLKITQTPQSFFIKDIVAAHREALEKGITNSVASCTMYIELGRKLYMSKGSEKNLKLTTTEDIEIFKALLQAKKDEWMH